MHSNKLWNFKGVTISLQKLTQWLGQCAHAADPEVTDIVYTISKLQSYMLKMEKEPQLKITYRKGPSCLKVSRAICSYASVLLEKKSITFLSLRKKLA